MCTVDQKLQYINHKVHIKMVTHVASLNRDEYLLEIKYE